MADPALDEAPSPESSAGGARAAGAPGLIVDDDALEVGPAQMRKSEFLGLLHAEVYATADEILPTVGRSAAGCPYITNWIDYGYTRSGTYVEAFVRRFARGAESVVAASDYLPLVRARLRSALLVWASTGEITGVPDEIAGNLPATDKMSAVHGVGAQVAGDGEAPAADAAGGAQLKARDGGPDPGAAPHDLPARLGAGAALDGGVKTRMETAFGYDFSRVRIHHDAGAARLSTSLNARAFTVGSHVAFGAGEYQPGTLVGDALLAHELAHVVQQGSAQPAVAAKAADGATLSWLEEDADRSAVGAVVALWGGANAGLAGISEHALPRLRSGLRLSRCSSCKSESEKKLEDAGARQDAGPPRTGGGGDASPQPQPSVTPAAPPLTPTGRDRLVPNLPAAGCVPTTGTGAARQSSAGFDVQYEKTHGDPGEITLRDREAGDRVLHAANIAAGAPSVGQVTIPSGIGIANEDHHYELEMIFVTRRGVHLGGLHPRPAVKFEVCRLEAAPTGDALLFAKAIYAEGVDEGEFPYVRDLVFNRVDWATTCPGDAADFGHDVNTVLNAPNQFGSVLNNTPKFRELKSELDSRSGDCQYTTPPRAGSPARCRLVNAAIRTRADGDGNTHNYLYFRSNTTSPNAARATNRWRYPGGNYYWEMRSCPPDRQPRPDAVPRE